MIPYCTPISFFNGESVHAGEEDVKLLDDFHPIKSMQIGDKVDAELLSADPFFLIARVLTTSMVSWNMLLNVIATDLENDFSVLPDDLDSGMQQLRFDSRLIDDVLDFINEHRPTVNAGGASSWPSAQVEHQVARKKAIQAALMTDLETMEARCSRFSKKCEAAIQLLVSVAQLRESAKGIEQAKQVQLLTQLAFVFIPASFVASIFGMNVAEFQKHPSIWIFFLTAICCSTVAWIVVSWSALRQQISNIKKKFKRQRSWKLV